jgi:hypothetical protein
MLCPKCGAPVYPSAPDGDFRYRPPPARKITGKTSDGYHTFDELYEHRHALFITLCRTVARELSDERVVRSQHHYDGTMINGWFILMIDGDRRGEQISYHLPLRLWDQTNFANTLDRAPDWDGHLSQDVLARLAVLR